MARAVLLHKDVASRVGAIDGVDLGRGHVIEVAAALFEVLVLRTGGEVSPLVLLVQIEVRVVRDHQGVRGPNAVAAGFVLRRSGSPSWRSLGFPVRSARIVWPGGCDGFREPPRSGRPGVLDAAARTNAISACLRLERGAKREPIDLHLSRRVAKIELKK